MNRPINWAFSHYYGLGGYSVPELRATVIGGRARPTLLSHEGRRLGINLRLGGYLALLNYTSPTEVLNSSLSAFTVVPGVELVVPVSPHVTLRPFLDIGLIQDLNIKERALLSGTGLLAEVVVPWRTFEIGVEPMASYVFSESRRAELEDALWSVDLRLDVRHPLGFMFYGAQADAGIYVQLSRFWGDTDLATATKVERQVELGFSLGTNPRPRVFLFRLPRLSVGYRFGTNFSGLRVHFGDRITRLPPAK